MVPPEAVIPHTDITSDYTEILSQRYKSGIPQLLVGIQTKRISYSLLVLPKERGSIGLRDPTNYIYAVHMTRALDWIAHALVKGWMGLKKDMLPFPLQTSP